MLTDLCPLCPLDPTPGHIYDPTPDPGPLTTPALSTLVLPRKGFWTHLWSRPWTHPPRD